MADLAIDELRIADRRLDQERRRGEGKMKQHGGSVQSEAFERLFLHGGDINSALAAFPDAPGPWIDLSTGVNPVPYPLPAFSPQDWTRLPSPADVAALQEVAAARFGAAPDEIVVAPGTQALIQWLPRLFPARRVAIPGPTYSGHESAWRAAGAEVLADVEAAAHRVVVNPNNPDGRRWPLASLRTLAGQAERGGGLLVVDEAFADFDEETLARGVPPATVVLRSFGKTYGLAGLRLGFAIAQAPLADRLRGALGAWAVSGPALTLGRRALADAAWLAQTRARLTEDVAWLDARLGEAGFGNVGGTLLFRLVRRADARDAFARLAAQGVLTRPFSAAPTQLRFGLPAPDDRARVGAALRGLQARTSSES